MSIEMLFSAKAGRAERLLKRQYNNPLFGATEIAPLDIETARKQDADEVEVFVNHFRDLLEQVTDMPANADADVVLKLKEELDRAYETSSGLTGEQDELRQMIKRLLGLMMQSMWKAVGNDAQGISKLEKEEQAREAHFALLEYPFITDMLAPQSPIDETLLVPSLLSEDAETVSLAIQLFDPEQQQIIYQQANQLLKGLDAEHERVKQAQQRLQEMAGQMIPASQQQN